MIINIPIIINNIYNFIYNLMGVCLGKEIKEEDEYYKKPK